MKTATGVPGLSRDDAYQEPISVPPREEQRRLVDILSRAEGIVRLRREAQKKAQELIPALFLDMFGDPATNPKGWPVAVVGDVSSVQGGLQLSKSRESLPLEFPYLRVANVHRFALDLSEIKYGSMRFPVVATRCRGVVVLGTELWKADGVSLLVDC